MPRPPLALVEFPADEPERACASGAGCSECASGRRGRAGSRTPPTARPFSLPYFAVDDLPGALRSVEELGGTVIHPGEAWAVCRDSEGTPFGLHGAARRLTS